MKLCIATLMLMVLVSCASKSDNKMTQANSEKKSEEVAKEARAPEKEEAKRGLASIIECRLGGDVRTMGVRKTDSGGCETVYTKHGKDALPATAEHGTSHCEGVSRNIASNLKGAGFKCK